MLKRQNVTYKFRRLFRTIDMEIVLAQSQLKLANKQIHCFKNSKSSVQQNKYFKGQIMRIKYEKYVFQLKQLKAEILARINEVLDMYSGEARHIWIEHCIKEQPISEIIKHTKVKRRRAEKIIDQINQDLINYKILD